MSVSVLSVSVSVTEVVDDFDGLVCSVLSVSVMVRVSVRVSDSVLSVGVCVSAIVSVSVTEVVDDFDGLVCSVLSC